MPKRRIVRADALFFDATGDNRESAACGCGADCCVESQACDLG